MSVEGIATLAAGLPGRNLQLDLGDLHAERMFTPAGARLVLNALMLAAESLPSGGTIHLSGDSERQVVMQIDGPIAAWPPGFIGYIADPLAAERALAPDGTTRARDLQGPVTVILARSLGLRVSVLMGAGMQAAPPLLLDLRRSEPDAAP